MQRFAPSIVAIACLAMLGCTTLKPLEHGARAPQLAVDDMVHVTYRDGSDIDLKVVELRDDGFVGTRSSGRNKAARVEVRYSEIAGLERREFSGIKTLGLIVLFLAILTAVAMAQDPLY